ncbi:hypothetical protein HYU95_03755 [Candidatus Daviesbacteria bacterium]|nr:hypothetical protein [Candidatus Daviesbacteria bacterium]
MKERIKSDGSLHIVVSNEWSIDSNNAPFQAPAFSRDLSNWKQGSCLLRFGQIGAGAGIAGVFLVKLLG